MNSLIPEDPSFFQVLRYGVVGVLNNLLGYIIYLVVTYFWLDPKIAITLLYPVGIATSYFGHARYSFSHQGGHTSAVIRFLIAHGAGYGINLLMLYVLADKLHYPHQLVQGAAIFVVGGALFVMQKYFVFRSAAVIEKDK